jgi:O-antigen/teichoic acid export membrane protein
MSYATRVLRGVALVLVFTVLANVMGYFLRLYLGRNFSVAEFGLVYSVFSLFGFLALFVYLGFTESVVKYASDFRAKKQSAKAVQAVVSVFWVEMAASILMAIAAIALAQWLATYYFRIPEAATLVVIYGLAMALSPFESMFLAVFQAYQKPLFYSTMQLFRAAFLLTVTYWLATTYPQLGIAVAVIPYLAIYVPLIVLCYPLLKKLLPEFRLTPKQFDLAIFKKIFWYSIPIMLTTVSWAILVQTDTIVITMFRSLEEVGFYNAALPIANILIIFPSSIISVFFPLVAELWTTRKQAVLRNSIRQAYVLIGIAIVPLAALFVVFPDIMLNLLFGDKFIPAARTLQLLTISGIFATFAMFNGSILAGIGKPGRMTYAVLVGAICNLIGDLILVPQFGYVGAGYATLAAQIAIFLCSIYFVQKHIRFQFPVLRFVLTLLCGVALAGTIIYLRSTLALSMYMKIAVAVTLGLLLYVALLFLLRIVTYAELRLLVQQLLNRQANV